MNAPNYRREGPTVNFAITANLLDAPAARQVKEKLLGLPQPVYRHHRLILGADGKRLAKRDAAMSLRSLREAGKTPGEIRAMVGLR